jgi:hypothetical protein
MRAGLGLETESDSCAGAHHEKARGVALRHTRSRPQLRRRGIMALPSPPAMPIGDGNGSLLAPPQRTPLDPLSAYPPRPVSSVARAALVVRVRRRPRRPAAVEAGVESGSGPRGCPAR